MVPDMRGFTLMELMVAIAIIAILAVVAVPTMQVYIEEARVKGAGEAIYNDVLLAREEAIKQTSNVKVVVQTGSDWCYGITTESTCNCQTANSCNLGQTNGGSFKNTTLATSGFTGSFTLSAGRGVVSNPGTMTVSASTKTLSVEINKLGVPHICSSDFAEYDPC